MFSNVLSRSIGSMISLQTEICIPNKVSPRFLLSPIVCVLIVQSDSLTSKALSAFVRRLMMEKTSRHLAAYIGSQSIWAPKIYNFFQVRARGVIRTLANLNLCRRFFSLHQRNRLQAPLLCSRAGSLSGARRRSSHTSEKALLNLTT